MGIWLSVFLDGGRYVPRYKSAVDELFDRKRPFTFEALLKGQEGLLGAQLPLNLVRWLFDRFTPLNVDSPGRRNIEGKTISMFD
jgi:hypothetical protein